jgi:hypothetical protein
VVARIDYSWPTVRALRASDGFHAVKIERMGGSALSELRTQETHVRTRKPTRFWTPGKTFHLQVLVVPAARIESIYTNPKFKVA